MVSGEEKGRFGCLCKVAKSARPAKKLLSLGHVKVVPTKAGHCARLCFCGFRDQSLAPAPEGPAAHWRAFTAGLDAAPLSAEEEDRAVAGADAVFARAQALADARLG